MNDTLEILKYTLPALVVFITAYLTLNKLINSETQRKKADVALNNHKIITPIRIQAYERMILFLERIAPQSIVIRLQQPNMTNLELQAILLKNIRSEYEHNMAHQLYISDKAWEMIKRAKENITKEVNQTVLQVKPDGPSIQFSKLVLEKMLDSEKDPTQKAIGYLKTEIRELFV